MWDEGLVTGYQEGGWVMEGDDRGKAVKEVGEEGMRVQRDQGLVLSLHLREAGRAK